MATDDFQTGRMGFRPARKKGKKEEVPNSGIEKGVTSAYPEIGNQPWTFKEIETKRKEKMKKKKQGIELAE